MNNNQVVCMRELVNVNTSFIQDEATMTWFLSRTIIIFFFFFFIILLFIIQVLPFLFSFITTSYTSCPFIFLKRVEYREAVTADMSTL